MESMTDDIVADALLTLTAALLLFGNMGLTAEDAVGYFFVTVTASMLYRATEHLQTTFAKLFDFKLDSLRKGRIIHTLFMVSSFFAMAIFGADSYIHVVLVYIMFVLFQMMLKTPEMKRLLQYMISGPREESLDVLYTLTAPIIIYWYMGLTEDAAGKYFITLLSANFFYHFFEFARKEFAELYELKVDDSRNGKMSMFKTRRIVHTFMLISSFFEQIFVPDLELSIVVWVYIPGLFLLFMSEIVQIRTTVDSKSDAA